MHCTASKTRLSTKVAYFRSWGIEDLVNACPQLAMIIDLTHTDRYALVWPTLYSMTIRYYSPADLQERGVDYTKLTVGGGGQVPTYMKVRKFQE